MTFARTVAATLGLGIMLGVPVSGICQAITSPSETKSPATAGGGIVDTAKRLEGRLFFSAQERQRVDDARKRGLVVGDDGTFVEIPPALLNGFVKRSDGKTAVWVDGDVRWDAQGKNVATLVPTNVGGPATYLKSTIGETQAASPRPNVRPKKVIKARASRKTVPRLLP